MLLIGRKHRWMLPLWRSKILSLLKQLFGDRTKEYHLPQIIVAICRNVHTENHFDTIQKWGTWSQNSEPPILILLRRHMATHTKPFSCKEKGCAAKPFGDKAGLMRHMREVHGQHIHGQASQMFKCPEPNCKRHLRGFPREYNMLSHHRRIHEEPTTENIVLETPNPGRKGDQMIITRPGDDNSLSGSHSKSDDTGLGTADSLDNVHQHEQSSSETALQVLRAQLNGLKAQREQALRTFDQKIVTMSTALRLVEEGLQNTTAVEWAYFTACRKIGDSPNSLFQGGILTMFLHYALKADASISGACDRNFGGLSVRGYKGDFSLSILFYLALFYSF